MDHPHLPIPPARKRLRCPPTVPSPPQASGSGAIAFADAASASASASSAPTTKITPTTGLLKTLQAYVHLPRERWPDWLNYDDRQSLLAERKRLKKQEAQDAKTLAKQKSKASTEVLQAFQAAQANEQPKSWTMLRVKVEFQLLSTQRVSVQTTPAIHPTVHSFLKSIEGARFEVLEQLVQEDGNGGGGGSGDESDEDVPIAAAPSMVPTTSTARVWTLPFAVYQPCVARLQGLRTATQQIVVVPIDEHLLRIYSSVSPATDSTSSTAEDEYRNIASCIPTLLWRNLYAFQREGVAFCVRHEGRVILGDEMGLGKSIQAIAVAAFYANDWPLLVVCPSSLRLTWKNELLRWLSNDALKAADTRVTPVTATPPPVAAAAAADVHDAEHGSVANENKKDDDEDDVSIRPRKRQRMLNRIIADSDDDEVDATPGAPTAPRTPPFEALWPSQIQVLMDGMQPLMGKGSQQARVVICSYDLIQKYRPAMMAQRFRMIICDESHYLKNPASQRTQAVAPLLSPDMAKRVLELSGTPATSHPFQLYAQVHALRPDLFPSAQAFGARYAEPRLLQGKIQYGGGRNLHELHALLKREVMIRRMKADVLTQLPAKTRTLIYTTINDPNLRYIHSSADDTANPSLASASAAATVPTCPLSRMQQWQETGVAKVPFVCSYMDDLLEATRTGKFLLFAHHQAVLHAYKAHLVKRGVGHMYIDGSTPAEERQVYVERFQADPSCRVAILSITAGGTGLTLTAADTVVFGELMWDPALLCQGEDRTHRIGQLSSVQCRYILAQNSVDDYLWPILQRKLELTGRALDGKKGTLAVSETVRTSSASAASSSSML